MPEMSPEIEKIRKAIEAKHGGDAKQLEVIFSEENRLIVEAPAGYGKTHTMVSRIAYLIATGRIPTPKRLLALTFSVNAAYKIKKDVAKNIPELLGYIGRDINIRNKSYSSNYHGFCRGVLRKYGYVLHPLLRDIDIFDSIDDNNTKNLSSFDLLINESQTLIRYNEFVKESKGTDAQANIDKYNEVVINKLLPKKSITYNAVITLTIKLFTDHPNILEFYHNYYTTILVDEFQDTNILSYWLLYILVCDKTNLLLLGDSLQRIYGFIGAVPNLMSLAKVQFNMTDISLNKNYRFASNSNMLQLDKIIRQNAITPYATPNKYKSQIDFNIYKDQSTEAFEVVKKARFLLSRDKNCNVAILVKQRGGNIDRVINTFNINDIPFFYGLFSDEDTEYMSFNKECLTEFIAIIKDDNRVSKKLRKKHLENVYCKFAKANSPIIGSSLKLLSVFWERLFIDYAFLSNEDKINLIMDTFGHNSLKQYMEYLDTKIVVSTVHAAKGLEWDYVIIPDMEKDSFPNYFGLCKDCQNGLDCNLTVNKKNEKKFLEELSVFYVAVTRARNEVFFTASEKQITKFGEFDKNISCFMHLPGLTY